MGNIIIPLKGGSSAKPGKMSASGNSIVKVGGTLPEPPNTLREAGRVRWYQIGNILVERKMWSKDWVPSLEQVCKNYDDLAALDSAIERDGVDMLVPCKNQQVYKVNPLLEYRLKVKCFIHSQLSAYGLTPMSSKGIFVQDAAMFEKKGVSTKNSMEDLFD